MFGRNRGPKISEVGGGKSNRRTGSIVFILVCLILTCAVYAIAIKTKQKALEDYETQKVVVAINDIKEYSEINSANADLYFTEIQVNEKSVVSGAFTSLAELKESLGEDSDFNTVEILKNEQVSSKKMIKCDSLIKDIANKSFTGFKVDSFDQAAGGTIRRGDKIVVTAVDKNKGTSEDVLTTIVDNALDSNGKIVSRDDDKTPTIAFNVYINNSDVAAFLQKIANCEVHVTKLN